MLQGRQFEPTLSHLTSRFPVDPGHNDNDYDADEDADAEDDADADEDADADADEDADAEDDADHVDKDSYPSPWPQTGLGSTHAPPEIIKITTFYNIYNIATF